MFRFRIERQTEDTWGTAQAIAAQVWLNDQIKNGLTFKRRVNQLVGKRAASGLHPRTDHDGRTEIANEVLSLRSR